MDNGQKLEVINFYDTHTISEEEIQAKVTASSIYPDELSENDHNDYD